MSVVAEATEASAPEAYSLTWPFPLFSYQKAGIDKLLGASSVLLADEMGLGKTIQAIAGLRLLASRGEARRALIVCPAGLILQWRRQLRLWAPELAISTVVGSADQRLAAWSRDANIFLTSYESLRGDLWISGDGGPAKPRWDVVVIDEAQRIKNPKADVAIAVKRLNRARSWALTGTPVENRLDDLISVLEFALRAVSTPMALRSGCAGCSMRCSCAAVAEKCFPTFRLSLCRR
jgi:SNF2 family DNA or RNA helicase